MLNGLVADLVLMRGVEDSSLVLMREGNRFWNLEGRNKDRARLHPSSLVVMR
jgi:hypothetical protein